MLFSFNNGHASWNFCFLFQKLKELYSFNPNIITCDFDFSLRKGIKTVYPNIKFFGCYYREFYELFANLRIIPFIINNQKIIDEFLKSLKNKYKDNKDYWPYLNKFFEYFQTTWEKNSI